MRVAFVGLGIMGHAMATNLVKAGHEVTVWNRTPGKLVEGAGVAPIPAAGFRRIRPTTGNAGDPTPGNGRARPFLGTGCNPTSRSQSRPACRPEKRRISMREHSHPANLHTR